MTRSLLALSLVLSSLLGGCATLNSVSVTPIPADRSRPIEARSTSWSVFGIYFSNSFVDEAVEELQQKCPQGKISGVLTRHSSYLYVIVTEREVTARAYCVAGGTR